MAQFPRALYYVPNYLKTKEMCDDAVDNNPAVRFLVLDRFKTRDMCIKALEVDPCRPAVCSHLFCDSTTIRHMVRWRLLVPRWWYDWMVQRLSKT